MGKPKNKKQKKKTKGSTSAKTATSTNTATTTATATTCNNGTATSKGSSDKPSATTGNTDCSTCPPTGASSSAKESSKPSSANPTTCSTGCSTAAGTTNATGTGFSGPGASDPSKGSSKPKSKSSKKKSSKKGKKYKNANKNLKSKKIKFALNADTVTAADESTVSKNNQQINMIVSLLEQVSTDFVTNHIKQDLQKIQSLVKNISYREAGINNKVVKVHFTPVQKGVIKIVCGREVNSNSDGGKSSTFNIQKGTLVPKLTYPYVKLMLVPTRLSVSTSKKKKK